ncbi:MAG: FecR domain-containing protein [Verrucomicrobiales bacterium]|nr:FecR domain-containing protein [Verrucomicrobiales bacterium]
MKPVLPSFDAATEDAPRFGSTPTSSDRRRNPRHRAVARGLLLACIASLLSGTARAADSGPSVVASPAAVATMPVDAASSQLVEASGKVEVARSTGVWEPARAGLILLPGHQLRTAAGSRATLQLGDRSVVRIHPSTLVEIRPPAHGTATTARSFLLRWGTLFFLNRERPARVEFETPLSRGAIRGT